MIWGAFKIFAGSSFVAVPLRFMYTYFRCASLSREDQIRYGIVVKAIFWPFTGQSRNK